MNPDYETTPIIMCSTESDISQIQLAQKSGVTDFVTKPIKPPFLQSKINKYL